MILVQFLYQNLVFQFNIMLPYTYSNKHIKYMFYKTKVKLYFSNEIVALKR